MCYRSAKDLNQKFIDKLNFKLIFDKKFDLWRLVLHNFIYFCSNLVHSNSVLFIFVPIFNNFNYNVYAYNTHIKAMKLYTSRLAVRQAAQAIDNKDHQKTQLCALAKAYATEECSKICNDALQLHGGYGYLDDYPVNRYVCMYVDRNWRNNLEK